MGPTATSSPASVSIAVIGDVHGSWGEQDVDYFNRSDYDLILFVGDLGGGALRSDLGVARSISRLTRPTFVLPGNHDAVHIAQLAAEVTQQRSLIALFSAGQERRREAFDKALGGVEMCGYGLHPQRKGTTDFDIISCRPHSMGGPSLAFAPFLSRAYGIDSLTASAERLTSLIDASSSNRLLFFAHNGPTGLGAGEADIWGCDFKRDGGDWGDEDLTLAIDHARRQGKEVLGVLAGHMHLRTRSGEIRPWRVEKDGVLYINAARVPRIFTKSQRPRLRHHVALTIGEGLLTATEVLVS
jgi:uncharacterized protein (TIGR04168 family)